MPDDELWLAPDFSLPLEAVTQTFVILAKRGAGKTYTASVMVEEMIGVGLPVCVIDPLGAWWGLRANAAGTGPGLPVVILGGDHADLPLPDTAGETVADMVVDERVPTVLDLSLLSKTAARRFVTAFMEHLYHRNREALHLVVDEADLFAPMKGGPDTARMLGAYEDVVRRGRQRGLGCTSITQRPAVLHTDIRGQAEVLLAMRMTGPRDVKAIDEWVSLHADDGEARAVKNSLATLPVGTAWVWSPGWLGVLQRIQVRQRLTFDSSATPKPGERRVVPTEFAAVDLDRLGTLLAAGETTAPAVAGRGATSAEVARLRRELAEARAAGQRIVEVPVLDGATAALLSDLVDRLDEITGGLRSALAGGSSPPTRPAPAALSVAAARSSPAPKRPTARSAPAEPDGTLARVDRAILTVLAQHGTRSITQVAILAGYAQSGGFRQALARLRAAGYIDGRGDITATPAGLDALGAYDPLPAGPALVDWWYGKLGQAERRILACLLAAWPEPVAVEDIAQRTGYAVSGGFRQALARLRQLDLASGRGALAVADILGHAARSAR